MDWWTVQGETAGTGDCRDPAQDWMETEDGSTVQVIFVPPSFLIIRKHNLRFILEEHYY